ncbi:hypothetical protein AB0M34_13515 [Nocardia sp. NPDC050193]
MAFYELLAAEPNRRGVVTAIATRWGFTNLGRFAQQYHREFGQQPSQTVRSLRAGYPDSPEPEPTS